MPIWSTYNGRFSVSEKERKKKKMLGYLGEVALFLIGLYHSYGMPHIQTILVERLLNILKCT